MSNKLTGKTRKIILGVAGLLMIIGIGIGEYSLANKLMLIGLILAFISSRFEIIRLKKIIKSFEKET
jgi:hypothetical protein